MNLFYSNTLDASSFSHLEEVLREEFNLVLKLLIYCYNKILENEHFHSFKKFPLEDHLRNVLVEPYLRKNKDIFGLSNLGFEVDVGEIGLGHKSIGFLDIKVTNAANEFLGKNDENIYYAIECKRLEDTSAKKNAYVEEGIKRFTNAKYGKNMPLACMIGFVESGNINDIVNGINSNLTQLSETIQKMLKFNIQSDFEYSYCSKHEKSDELGPIDLYHLLFDYKSVISYST